MGLLDIIRRMDLRQNLPNREIARRTGVSDEPKFATPERSSKLAPFAKKLAGWLKTQTGKSRKQRRTLKQRHTDLVALGVTGSYNRVAAFAHRWRADRQSKPSRRAKAPVSPVRERSEKSTYGAFISYLPK